VLGIILAYGLSMLRPNFSSNASITARFRRSAASPIVGDTGA
jgi:hypothetical protein